MEDNVVMLDVGGTMFKATVGVLNGSGMFKAMLTDCPYSGDVIYIDKCGHVFKHVLGYLRDYRYPTLLSIYTSWTTT